MRAYLAELAQHDGFFGSVVESGAYACSIEMILSGDVDTAAIDSTVLEWLQVRDPELADKLRVVETIGPSPIPPWVVSTNMSDVTRCRVRQVLLNLHSASRGESALAHTQLAKFIPAYDRDYDPIRRRTRQTQAVLLA